MASCATFLLMEHVLLCMPINVGIVKLYLKDDDKIFLDNNKCDPTSIGTGSTSPVLHAIYHKAKRWEDMTNHQEPVRM